jgi:hypothetical protein
MARYLKRGATYEATAPLNSDDPLLSDLENDGSSTPSTGTVAIDDLTTIALVEKDIIDLTSANATETVDALSGGTANICYELRPEDGLELTITFTAAASAGAGDIVGPTADIVLDGSKGDYIKVIKRGSVYYQVDAMNYL